MKRNILVFGTIAGLLVSAFMGTSMAIMLSSGSEMEGGSGAMIIGFASMAVAFSFVFVGIKNFRDKQNGGVLTFGQGFLMGFLISLLASTLYVITWAVEYHYFFPDFMEKYAALQIKELNASHLKPDELAKKIKGVQEAKENYKNPLFFALYTYTEILPLGLLITVISALILKRKHAPKDVVGY